MLFHKPVVAERLEREGSQHAKVLGKTKETNVSVFVFTLIFLVVKTEQTQLYSECVVHLSNRSGTSPNPNPKQSEYLNT